MRKRTKFFIALVVLIVFASIIFVYKSLNETRINVGNPTPIPEEVIAGISTLSLTQGGTGLSSYTAGDMVYASSSARLFDIVAVGSVGQCWTVTGAAVLGWGPCGTGGGGGTEVGISYDDGATFTNAGSISFAPGMFTGSVISSVASVNLNWGAGGVPSRSTANAWTALNDFSGGVSISAGTFEVEIAASMSATSFSGATTGISLDEIENLTTDKTFTMAANNLIWNFTTPSEGMVLNATGAFTDHVLHVHQSTGNPGAGTALLHLEADDSDVVGLTIGQHAASTALAFEITSGEAHFIGGNVGIGTSSPAVALDITGSASVSGDFEIVGYASASTYYGEGLIVAGDCNDTTDKFLYDSGTGLFECGTLATGDIPDLSATYLPIIGGTLTGDLFGTNVSLSGNFEAGGYASISGRFDVGGSASVSGSFETAEKFVLGAGSFTGIVDTSNWDVTAAGSFSGLTGLISTGEVDFSGASGLMIPTGAPDEEGELAYDTTDNTLVMHDGTAVRVVGHDIYQATYTVYADADWDNEAIPIWQAPKDMAVTIVQIDGSTMGAASSLSMNFEERAFGSLNSAGTDVFTGEFIAEASGTSSDSFSNAGIAANAHVLLTTGSSAETTGTVDVVTGIIYYRKDVE